MTSCSTVLKVTRSLLLGTVAVNGLEKDWPRKPYSVSGLKKKMGLVLSLVIANFAIIDVVRSLEISD